MQSGCLNGSIIDFVFLAYIDVEFVQRSLIVTRRGLNGHDNRLDSVEDLILGGGVWFRGRVCATQSWDMAT